MGFRVDPKYACGQIGFAEGEVSLSTKCPEERNTSEPRNQALLNTRCYGCCSHVLKSDIQKAFGLCELEKPDEDES